MLGFRKNKTSAAADKPEKTGLFKRLRDGLSRTRHSLTEGIVDLVLRSKALDASLLEEIETTLLVADVGVDATSEIIDRLTEQISLNQFADAEELMASLHRHMQAILAPSSQPLVIPEDKRPFVILMVGINGAGKTTTIGKLAHRFKQQGLKVMLAAGDTFRAAAVEQLQSWGERNGVPVVSQPQGADSASVIFDALQSAKARDI
ncbi:MAG: signal recognition particle receptor subunit alpha, partial [Gammaproteobacteria bacterium]